MPLSCYTRKRNDDSKYVICTNKAKRPPRPSAAALAPKKRPPRPFPYKPKAAPKPQVVRDKTTGKFYKVQKTESGAEYIMKGNKMTYVSSLGKTKWDRGSPSKPLR
jgi:hypothetical protein